MQLQQHWGSPISSQPEIPDEYAISEAIDSAHDRVRAVRREVPERYEGRGGYVASGSRPSACDLYSGTAVAVLTNDVPALPNCRGHQSTIDTRPTTLGPTVHANALAGVRSGINQRVTAHTMRHSFATQLLRAGYDIRTVQELLGHRDLNTTMIYLHVLDRGAGVRSPLDLLRAVPKPSGAAS